MRMHSPHEHGWTQDNKKVNRFVDRDGLIKTWCSPVPCNVKDNDACSCLLVINPCHRAKPFLACNIPQLELNRHFWVLPRHNLQRKINLCFKKEEERVKIKISDPLSNGLKKKILLSTLMQRKHPHTFGKTTRKVERA